MSTFGGGFGSLPGVGGGSAEGVGEPKGSASAIAQSVPLIVTEEINAGYTSKRVWIRCLGFDWLSIEVQPLSGLWPTGLVIAGEQSSDRFRSNAFASAVSISALGAPKVSIPITGIGWACARISTVGTDGEYVRITLTATKNA